MAKTETVKRATGRDQAEWYRLLDGWGAPGRPFKEISEWLTGEHGVSRWWAQKLIVEYEQDRGIRPAGVRSNGTFEISASRTVGVPAQQLFDAFVDPRLRRRWLADEKLTLRTSHAPRSARFDWESGESRVAVSVEEKDQSKTTVTVIHERLRSQQKAQETKAMWIQRLGELKTLLEREDAT